MPVNEDLVSLYENALYQLSNTHDIEVFRLLVTRLSTSAKGNVLLSAAWFGYELLLGVVLEDGTVPIDASYVVRVRGARVVTTPLIGATECAHPRCVHALLMAGADHTAVDLRQARALRYALRGWHATTIGVRAPSLRSLYVRTCRVLAEHTAGHAIIDACDPDGWTPLMDISSFSGASEMVWFLLSEGADPNRSSASGVTPLMLAAEAGDLRSCHALVESGAMVDSEDVRGRTAIDHARLQGRRDVLRFLHTVADT